VSGQLRLFESPSDLSEEAEGEDPRPPVSARDFYRTAEHLPAEFEPVRELPPERVSTEDDDPYWAELVEQEEWARGDRGLSLLVELVQNGTVDPWDVDLEVVVERYMEAVDALTTKDLPTSGRLLFFASVLIRLKAQFLAGRGQEFLFVPESEEGEDWIDDGYGLDLDYQDMDVGDLEELGLSRRGPGEILVLPRQRIQKRRPITIQDLLDALENSELHERKKEASRDRALGRRAKMPFQSVKEAMDTLHQDDLVRDIEHASRLVTLAFQSMEKLSFESLKAELDEVSAFLAVLFLAARGEVDLDQDAFYGKIELIRPPPGRAAVKIIPRERFKPRKPKKRAKKEPPKDSPETLEALAPAPKHPQESLVQEELE
jgi:segregation and condensation protein A